MGLTPVSAATALPALADLRHWVFDLDGTLTVPVHDFALIRRALDIPADADILGHLAALPDYKAQRDETPEEIVQH